MKQSDFWGYFGKRNATYEAGSTIDRDLPYKINNKKQLLTDKQEPLLSAEAVNYRLCIEEQLANLTIQYAIRTVSYHS